MKFLKFILGLFVLLLVIGAFLPSSTTFERSVTINAPQDLVYEYVNSMPRFNEWSPWHSIDPNTKYTFTGPESGVGHKMAWQSDHENVGSGSQEIVEASPPNKVVTFLDFGPMGSANAAFTLDALGDGTKVVWSFYNEHGWAIQDRYFGLMTEKFVGPMYEDGLSKFKTVAEKAATEKAAAAQAIEAALRAKADEMAESMPDAGTEGEASSTDP